MKEMFRRVLPRLLGMGIGMATQLRLISFWGRGILKKKSKPATLIFPPHLHSYFFSSSAIVLCMIYIIHPWYEIKIQQEPRRHITGFHLLGSILFQDWLQKRCVKVKSFHGIILHNVMLFFAMEPA